MTRIDPPQAPPEDGDPEGFLLGILIVALLAAIFWPYDAKAQTLFADGFEGEPVGPQCLQPNPLVGPAGWSLVEVPWSTVWSSPRAPGAQTYPDSGALSNLPFPRRNRNEIVAIPFVALADTTIRLNWTTPVQPNGNIGYPRARVATAIFISLSECPWDVRGNSTSDDPDQVLRRGCRKFSSGTIITYTTRTDVPESTGSVCKLNAGELYWMNMITADPNDGLAPGESTCVDPDIAGCDVQGSHKPI